MRDYQKTIAVSNPIEEVYSAITEHITDWWSNDFMGSAAKNGDSYDIAFNNTRKTFVIQDVIPNKQVVWKCVKAHIDMASLKNKSEWVGTKIVWSISSSEKETMLTFLHEGLNKSFECYDVCELGWNMFLASLKLYLETGKGKPFVKQVEEATAG